MLVKPSCSYSNRQPCCLKG